MITTRHICISAVAFLVAAGIFMFVVKPASAAILSCEFSSNNQLNQVSATCNESTATQWFLQLTCSPFDGSHDRTAKGTLETGPGFATSIARCPINTEITDSKIVEL
jgi:hypothetical protein